MITIYQIKLTHSDINDANLHGFHSVAAVEAKSRMMLGAKKWDPEYAKFYVPTYEVHTEDLEAAFEETNLWNLKVPTKVIRKGSSSSVGDIFVKDGISYIVDNFGFVEIGQIDFAA